MRKISDDVLRRVAGSEAPVCGYTLTFHGDSLGCSMGDVARALLDARAALRRVVECCGDECDGPAMRAARACLPKLAGGDR